MYKEIDQEFIIRTLRTYDARTIELRREMSTQYTLLNTQTLDDELLQATAYPIYSPSEARHQMDKLPQQHRDEQKMSYNRLSEIADAAIDLLLQEEPELNFAALDEAVDLSIDEMSRWHMHDMFDLQAEHRPLM